MSGALGSEVFEIGYRVHSACVVNGYATLAALAWPRVALVSPGLSALRSTMTSTTRHPGESQPKRDLTRWARLMWRRKHPATPVPTSCGHVTARADLTYLRVVSAGATTSDTCLWWTWAFDCDAGLVAWVLWSPASPGRPLHLCAITEP